MLFRLPVVSRVRHTYSDNPGLKDDEIFGKIGNKKMWVLMAYVDHYSPYRVLKDPETTERDFLKHCLEASGHFKCSGQSFMRQSNHARRIVDGEDENWNAAIQKYRELQGIGSMEALEKIHKNMVKFATYEVDVENPQHEWIVKEQRNIIHQRILSKIEEEKNLIKMKSGAYVSKDEQKREGTGEDDDEIRGYDPDNPDLLE